MTAPRAEQLRNVFAACAGFFLGLCLLKFGNPIVLEHLIAPPANLLEFAFQPWPVVWGWGLLGLIGLLGLAVARWETPHPRWMVALPIVWLVWQGVAALQTVDRGLTEATLAHFCATVAGFYVGVFALAPVKRMGLFWAGMLVGFAIMVWTGFEQHFGGLEATRQYIYSQPDWDRLPAEQLKRLGSNRVFATLLYPNTLAGVLLLLVPPLAVAVWRLSDRLAALTRAVLVALLVWCGLACLYWSGSKAGWLIALVLVSVTALRARAAKRWRWALALLLVGVGLTAFCFRFAQYFKLGATSVGARFDYWQAATRTFREKPLFGAGPGTFSITYRRIKPPDAEMARLAHNDYLQQASDSGFPGFLLYGVFQTGSLALLYCRCRTDPMRFAIWLGLLGWGLQSCVEFGLYIPALGSTAFWLLGWLWGTPDPGASPNAIDKVSVAT